MSIIEHAEWLHALFVKSHGDDKWIEAHAVKNGRATSEVQIDVCEGDDIASIRLSIVDARKMAAYILDGTGESA